MSHRAHSISFARKILTMCQINSIHIPPPHTHHPEQLGSPRHILLSSLLLSQVQPYCHVLSRAVLLNTEYLCAVMKYCTQYSQGGQAAGDIVLKGTRAHFLSLLQFQGGKHHIVPTLGKTGVCFSETLLPAYSRHQRRMCPFLRVIIYIPLYLHYVKTEELYNEIY